MGKSIQNPSILIKYLNAIGPGTVICKTGPKNFDIRFDGSAHEVLRSVLQGYRWLPVSEKLQCTQTVQTKLANPTTENDATMIAFYKRYFPAGASRLKAAGKQNGQPINGLKGPVVFVGRPTTFANIDSDQNSSNALNTLLNSCKFFDADQSNKTDSFIFIGQSKEGQTVIVFNGKTTKETFAGVELACESGTPNLDAAVYNHINNPRDNQVVLKYQVCEKAAVFQLAAQPKLTDAEGSPLNPLEIARKSRELEQIAKREPQTASYESHLVQYLRAHGPASIIVKSYPAADQRDDESAKDLILKAIPNAEIFPVRDAPPRSLSAEQLKKFLDWLSRENLGESLASVDEFLTERVQGWLQQFDAVNGADADSVPSSGPVIVLGTAESYSGGREVITQGIEESMPVDSELRKPQSIKTALQTLIHSGGYPNRYILDYDKQENILLIDRKSLQEEASSHISTEELHDDIGLIHIGLGLNQRLVLNIAGANWLGTYAGAHILFNEKLPEFDKLFESLISGKAKQIDIAFRCERVPYLGGLAIHYEFLHPIDGSFTWSGIAERQFRPLFRCLHEKTSGATPIFDDNCFNWTVSKSDEAKQLTIEARAVREIANTKFFCSEPTKETLKAIDAACDFLETHLHNRRVHAFLIVAPTGTGKESVARHIHEKLRNGKAFISVNTPVVVPTLFQSELFGIKKGAANDVKEDRKGLVMQANNGTLFLDEFLEGKPELQESLQPALLRLIEEGEIRKVGDVETEKVYIVLICTSNIGDSVVGLEQATKQGENCMRPDLFARFRFKFELLKLRDRPIEILPTFVHYVCSTLQRNEYQLVMSIPALKLLLHYEFAYNFRSVKHVAERVAMSLNQEGSHITSSVMMDALGINVNGAEDMQAENVSIRVISVGTDIPRFNFCCKLFDWSSLTRNAVPNLRAFFKDKSKEKRDDAKLIADNDHTFEWSDSYTSVDSWIKFIVEICCFLGGNIADANMVVGISIGSIAFQDSHKGAIKGFVGSLNQYIQRALKGRKASPKETEKGIVEWLLANAATKRAVFDKWSSNRIDGMQKNPSLMAAADQLVQFIGSINLNTTSSDEACVKYFAIWLLTGSYVGPPLSNEAPKEEQQVDRD